MKSRKLFGVSACLNVIAFSAVAYVLASKPGVPPEAVKTIPATHAPNRVVTRPTAAPSRPQFHWREIESDDYRTYIAHLRAIGCPEETLRDIIIADVNKLYAPRVAAVSNEARRFKYWQTGLARERLTSETQRRLRELNKEKSDLLKELLGAGVEQELERLSFGNLELNAELTFGFLPDAKRKSAQELVERYQNLEREIHQRSNGLLTAWDRKELKKLQDLKNGELAALLAPAELAEYELRHSPTAESLRRRMAGVDLTEAEFQKLFQLQKEFDDQFGIKVGPPDKSSLEKRFQAQRDLDEALKSVLGEQKYSQYQQSQDPAYRGLVQVAENHHLSQDTVSKVYDIKKAGDEQRRQLFSDRTLQPDQRTAALQAMNEEIEKTMLSLLGENALKDFRENAGVFGFPGNAMAKVQTFVAPGGANGKFVTIESADVIMAPVSSATPTVKVAAPK